MLNKIMLIGNLGNAPESRTTITGKAMATFSIATSKNIKDAAGNKEKKTTWHNCICFDKTAELAAQYLAKGSKVYVEGELDKNKYTDKDGVEKYSVNVVVQNITFLDKKEDGTLLPNASPRPRWTEEQAAAENAKNLSRPPLTNYDDVPF